MRDRAEKEKNSQRTRQWKVVVSQIELDKKKLMFLRSLSSRARNKNCFDSQFIMKQKFTVSEPIIAFVCRERHALNKCESIFPPVRPLNCSILLKLRIMILFLDHPHPFFPPFCRPKRAVKWSVRQRSPPKANPRLLSGLMRRWKSYSMTTSIFPSPQPSPRDKIWVTAPASSLLLKILFWGWCCLLD